jgi:hypothetical protein
MKKIFQIAILGIGILFGCGSQKQMGTKINEPFSGNKYESNDRYFRGVGKGESKDQNISESKADLQAKKELAQQMSTNIKAVTDQYLTETEVNKASEINDKFESLIREVTNTSLADLRKMGQEQYIKEGIYTTYVAYEIHKKDMFRYLKKQAKLNKQLNDADRKKIEDILDEEIKKAEALDEKK